MHYSPTPSDLTPVAKGSKMFILIAKDSDSVAFWCYNDHEIESLLADRDRERIKENAPIILHIPTMPGTNPTHVNQIFWNAKGIAPDA